MATWTSFLALLGCSSTAQNQTVRGPMSISYSLERDYRLNLFTNNSSGNLIGTHTTSYFNINYQGKPVVLTSKEGKKAQIWEARFLTDAPKTAILATSNSIFLITDDAGQVHTSTVVGDVGDLCTYQWLDSEHGQPGRAQSSTPTDNSGASRFLSGGRFLLVDERSVLDVHTLAIYPFDLISEGSIKRTDGFVRVSTRLVSFSPGKTQLVFLGTRYNNQRNRSEYAMLGVDFVKNQVYAVPFRPSDMQFIWAEDATSDWFATYFDWTTDSGGKEILSVHPYTQHPPWHGRWAQDPGEGQPIRYELKPVLPGMFDHFMSWAKKQYPAIEPRVERSEGMISAVFTINGSVFNLYVRDDYKSLSLQSTDQTLLRTIGDQFDGELRKGRFQEGFSEMDPD
ncbi:hypothetical protein CWM47_06010 [Spirosoma pollinicola]|uniref:Uncharacterized protein n=2 Tax=Spirosoma pollinicola TaxID=2057025 RepID=A0A2K8ZBJ4_9BACT|nr:hypothetical protein CWM47_06010 [Spirosoma pollinicola]